MSLSQVFVREDAGKGEFMSYSRFAIYYVPPDGPLADFGAAWLGWDIRSGRDVAQFSMAGLDDITMTPRKYGFHGTLKPPFGLREGYSLDQLQDGLSRLAAELAPATCGGLQLTPLGRFLALTPQGPLDQLQRVAAACVRDLDGFRAPAAAAELARRRKAGLTPAQDALLMQWGYPYVMEEFRFHLTLTDRLPRAEIPAWTDTLQRHLPDLSGPFVVDQIALCGEREDGRFELLHRYTLSG
jgi:putative phosphonate metabolism protein